MIAQLQHITYSEFLPVIVGKEVWKRFGLDPGGGDAYDLDIDASVLNVYASAAGQVSEKVTA